MLRTSCALQCYPRGSWGNLGVIILNQRLVSSKPIEKFKKKLFLKKCRLFSEGVLGLLTAEVFHSSK